MKKIIRTLGLACLAGLFAVTVSSCKKSQDNTTTVELTMDEIEDVYPGNERAYINTLNGGIAYWNRNDQVRAYNLDVTNNPNAYQNSTTAVYQCGNAAEDQPYATFYGPSLGAKLSPYYYFFYPVNMVNGVLGPYNVDTFMVANTQYYIDKVYQGRHYTTIDPQAFPLASRHTSTSGFMMDHLFGYFRLWVTGEGHVTSVVLNDPNHALSGYATLRIDKVDANQLRTMVDKFINYNDSEAEAILTNYVFNPAELNLQLHGEGNTLTLDCSDNPIELDTYVANGFIFSVRPGAMWWNADQEPFTVTFNFNDRAPVTISGGNFVTGIDTRAFISKPGWCKNVNAYVGLMPQ